MPAAAVAERLATDGAAGLASDEVAARLAAYGANELDRGEQLSPAGILLAQLTSPMILLLAAAGALSAALGDVTEAVVISSSSY